MPTQGNPHLFSALHHAHNSRDADDLPYWFGLAAEFGDPILELGCGTGRVLLPLAQAGYQVYGLDHDADMLAYLCSRMASGMRPPIGIIQADLCRYRFDQAFPLILLPCNTYTTLGVDQRKQALALVRSHLEPQGVFSISIPNPVYLRRLPKTAPREVEDVLTHPVDGEPVQVSSAWKRTSSQFIIDWTYDHLLPDGMVDRFTYRVTQNILSIDDLMVEFRLAGLMVKEMYGDFERSPLRDDSIYLIVNAVPENPWERS